MAFSADPADPARSRLLTLGPAPAPPPASPPPASPPPAVPAPARTPRGAGPQRVGWPPAAPGTPAARLRFPQRPELPEPDPHDARPGDGWGRWDDDTDPGTGYGTGYGTRYDTDDRGYGPGYGGDAEGDGGDRGRGRVTGPRDPAGAWSSPSWGRRVVERWLPASWRDARWDPGRLGALALAVVAALAAVVAAVGVWSSRPTAEPVPALPVVTGGATSSGASPGAGSSGGGASAGGSAPGTPLVVSVAGKVARPGLLRLPEGARVGDAVAAAGGALPATDLTGLNLAARLTDGDQVLVGVAPPPGAAAAGTGAAAGAGAGSAAAGTGGSGAGGAGAGGAGAAGASPGGALDLNAASLEQLDALPGVGPVTAKKILDWRTQNGRFASVEQLREVNGIGEARFATLRPLVRV